MYLTRMELNTKRRSTMKALISPNLLHGAIEAAFPGERTRKLWRIDRIGGHSYLLLLSDREPDLTNAAEQFGMTDREILWESKDYRSLLTRIQDHTVWHFRLTANPTRSSKSAEGERGTVHAHITPYYQIKWLMDRCEKKGFAIREEDVLVTESHWQRFWKGRERKQPVTLLAVTYEGILTVTDENLFRNTLMEGVGRGKAFGMGLLTVVRKGGTGNV